MSPAPRKGRIPKEAAKSSAPKVVLAASGVRELLTGLTKHLSTVDAGRLNTVAGRLAAATNTAPLGPCLDDLFSRQPEEKQLSAFRSLRTRLANAAGEAQIDLELCVDTRKRTQPADRTCWFEGPDLAETRVANLTTASTVNDTATSGVLSKAIDLTPNILVWWDDADHELAQPFFEQMKIECGASFFSCKLFSRNDIQAGEDRIASAQALLRRSDQVVVLISRKLLARHDDLLSIKDLADARGVFPVDLEPIADEHNLRELDGLERFPAKGPKGPRAFSECTTKKQPPFVQKFCRIMWRSHPLAINIEPNKTLESTLDRLNGDPVDCFAPSRARAFSTEDRMLENAAASMPAHTEGSDAITMLMDWLTSDKETQCCAVLGEYGIGKTTTLKEFARRLKEARRDDPSLPQPIFLDLRHESETLRLGKSLTLDIVIDEAIRSALSAKDPAAPTHREILALVRSGKALLIFDGLDEKLVHMTEAQGRTFIHELWKAIKPWNREDQTGGRMIVSCRSAYFRSFREQLLALRGSDRDDVRASDCKAIAILPFSEDQIRAYLTAISVPNVDEALELFKSVHNLAEVVTRPYLLFLVSKQLEDIELRRARGEIILGVSLYRGFVERWLERDAGKHRIAKEDKPKLMQELAADMWRGGDREWAWSKVREWLRKRLAADPTLILEAAGQRPTADMLEEDFRTSTFILRPDASDSSFRFAHTSMHEYFLAERLFRAAVDGEVFVLDMPNPSAETLDFLGQMLMLATRAERDAAVRTLSNLLASPGNAALLALRYWMIAETKRYPAFSPTAIDLSGMGLQEFVFTGASATRPLNLSGAKFIGTNLTRAVFRDVLLHQVDFSDANALRAEFHNVEMDAAIFSAGSKFIGIDWRGGAMTNIRNARVVDWHDACLAPKRLALTTFPANYLRRPFIANHNSHIPEDQTELAVGMGHTNIVYACAWSTDGTRLLSASADNTLAIWDAASGRVLLMLKGHAKAVTACAWSPDGTRVLSASNDGTLAVWDAATGQKILTLVGHTQAVRACTWSPDGKKILSSSRDSTLTIWDAVSGQRLVNLQEHASWATACAWSPDGTKLLSASRDKTLTLWDAASGQRLFTLRGHTSWVTACTWSPDSTRILSASRDKTLAIWDAATGRQIFTLEGHAKAVTACVWSPDGMQLLSASEDTTLAIWDAASGRKKLTLLGHFDRVTACAWSPDGTRLLSASYDNNFIIWDSYTGTKVLTIQEDADTVNSCAWSPDSTRFATSSYDTTLATWDATSGKKLVTFQGHTSSVTACAWSPNGMKLVSASGDATLAIWDTDSGRQLLVLKGHTSAVRSCVWSPDGTRVLSASEDDTLIIWDAAAGRKLFTLEGHFDWIRGCAWSPDNTRILSASDDGDLTVWDATSGKRLLTFLGHTGAVYSCAWSPEGTRILSASEDNTIAIWDVISGHRIRILSGHAGAVTDCAWSPDGTGILSAAEDNTLAVWDAVSGQRLLTLDAHTDSVTACAWSPDGKKLLSASWDSTVAIWDAASGQRLRTILYLSPDRWASIDPVTQRFLHAGPEAWRDCGWRYFDEDYGFTRVLPLEYFGPIPG